MKEDVISTDSSNKYRDLAVFNDLPSYVLQSIDNISVFRSFIPGKLIISEGKPCEHAYLVLRGEVNIFCNSFNGQRYVFSRLGPGDWFNATTCIKSCEFNPASASALTPAKILAIACGDFRRLLDIHPIIGVRILENISSRQILMTNQVKDMALLSVSGRVAHFLIEHTDESGIIHWQCTQKDVADRLGTSADVVGRVLRNFADDGIIEMPVKNCIVVINPEKLKLEALK